MELPSFVRGRIDRTPTALFFGFAAILTAGCATNLPVKKIAPGATASGYPYRLKFTQFEIPVTWRITKCDEDAKPPVQIKISVDPKDKASPDPDQFYAIDPRVLQGPFRATDFAMEWYEDRSIKSINSSVDDQTGTAIVDLLTGAGNIARVALAGGAGVNAPRILCPASVTDALAAIDGTPGNPGQEEITKKVQKAVEDQIVVVTRLTQKTDAKDDKAKQQLAAAKDELETLTASLEAEQAKLKRLLDEVSETRTLVWPQTSHEYASSKPLRPSAKALEKWGIDSSSLALNVYFALLPLEGGPMPAGGDTSAPQRVSAGLPYREPRLMRLYVCSESPCGEDRDALGVRESVVKASEVQVLQAGTTFYLPFRAQTFASIKSSAAFAQSGVLTSAGSQQLRGGGSGLAAAFKGATEPIAATVKAGNSADTARLQARAEELKAKKALQDAEAALAPAADADKQAAIKAFQTDATLATAERTKIEAEAALAAARAQLAQ
jgi:hypothetical protein